VFSNWCESPTGHELPVERWRNHHSYELKEAQIVIEQWPVNYNTKRPHSPGDQIHLHSPWL